VSRAVSKSHETIPLFTHPHPQTYIKERMDRRFFPRRRKAMVMRAFFWSFSVERGIWWGE
jgi:hypothetical protein